MAYENTTKIDCSGILVYIDIEYINKCEIGPKNVISLIGNMKIQIRDLIKLSPQNFSAMIPTWINIIELFPRKILET